MSTETDAPTTESPDESARTVSVPRWAVVGGLVVVSLPLLMMASMMLAMGWLGPPMHEGMAGPDPGFLRVAGFVPLLVVLGVTYGGYRLVTADES